MTVALATLSITKAELCCAAAEYADRARLQTLQQLVRAVLREKLVRFLTIANSGSKCSAVIPLYVTRRTIVIDTLELTELDHYAEIGAIRIFDDSGTNAEEITTAEEFIASIRQEVEDRPRRDLCWQRLLSEIENSRENLSMHLAYRARWNTQLAAALADRGRSLWQEALAAAAAGHDQSILFEQWAAVGHPHHPCAKTKLGFSKSDLIDYAPDFRGQPSIGLAAIRRDAATTVSANGGDDPTSLLCTHFPDWIGSWKEALAGIGLSPRDYWPIPLHPWQERNKVRQLFAAAIERREVVLPDSGRLPAAATLSMRTVAPIGEPTLPHIKLPVSVQATSALRDLTPEQAVFGTRVSRFVSHLFAADPVIASTISILPEILAISYGRGGATAELSPHLSAVLRQSPASVLGPGQHAVVVAALLVSAPGSGKPLIIEIMEAAGARRFGKQKEYLWHYIDIVLHGAIAAFCRYGIALEAHQQNALAVFGSDSRPTRILLRDLASIRIHEPALRRHSITIDVPAGIAGRRRRLSVDRAVVREQLIDTTLHLHLGELIRVCCRHWGTAAQPLWATLRARLEFWLREFDEVSDVDRAADRLAFFEEGWNTKAWLQKRLNDPPHDDVVHRLTNPFAGDGNAAASLRSRTSMITPG